MEDQSDPQLLGVLGLAKLLPSEDRAELDRILGGGVISNEEAGVPEILKLREQLESLEKGKDERREMERKLIKAVERVSAEIEKRLETASGESKDQLEAMQAELDQILEGLNPN